MQGEKQWRCACRVCGRPALPFSHVNASGLVVRTVFAINVASSGNVSSGGAYQTSYMTTGGGGDWGGRPFNTTSTYIAGAHMLLAGGTATPECYGSDLLDGHGSCLIHASVTDSTDLNAELFNSVAAMLSDAFAFGRTFNGIKTCVGTEAPLAVPATATNATVQELYEGVFQRLAAADIPLDYYWIWTSEGYAGPVEGTFCGREGV